MENMCYAGHDESEGLGFLPVLAAGAVKVGAAKAIVSGAKSAVKAVTHAFDSYDHDKDAGRRKTNAGVYDLARATHEQAAYDFLRGMSGKFGKVAILAPVPPANITADKVPTFASGWASPPAREDAFQKQAALKADGYDQPTLAQQAAAAATSRPAKLGFGLLVGLALVGVAMSGGPKRRASYRRNPARRRRTRR